MTVEAVVIGGGQAGLAVSHHLARRGIEHTVLERGRVAETWRSQRWDSFALNTPSWMSLLPGETDPLEPRDAFLGRDAYIAHLQAYADDHRIPVQTGVDVTTVAARPDGGTFVVTADAGAGTFEIETRSVIVASGIQRVPSVPVIGQALPAGVRQIHAADYRRPADLPTGAVLVVGSAQSGVQIVEDLLEAGRTVYMCTSAVPRMRRRSRGRDTLEWLVGAGAFDVTPERLPDPRMRHAKMPTISGVGRFGHTVSLQALAERGAILLGRPKAVEGDRLLLDDTVGANIAFGDARSAELNVEVEEIVQATDPDAPPLEPDPADAPHPDPISVRSPGEIDLDAAGIGTFIWATGFGGDFSYLGMPVLDGGGVPVHQRGVAEAPGIYFLGFPWLHTRKSGIIFGVDEDSAYIADRVAARASHVRHS